MSDNSNDQYEAEQTDLDVLSDDGEGPEDSDDPTGTLAYPPERPLGVDQYGTTWAEERVDEPIEERAAREEAEVGSSDPFRDNREFIVGRLVGPGAEDDAVALEDTEDEALALLANDGLDDLSAEEAAMHFTRAPD
jgi:hypothetical protein